MQTLRQNSSIFLWSILYLLMCGYLIWNDMSYLALFPIGLIAVYVAIIYSEIAFLAIAFLTPLSVNIEEFVNGFGLFVPTEPLLFGLLILFVFQHVHKSAIPRSTFNYPIIWTILFYLLWVFITAILSTSPVASFKFLLARLWLMIPMFFIGQLVFAKERNITLFIWLFCIGMTIAITYTLLVHAQYRFGEKEGHWVMWPFFKDHTIYGAAVGIVTPLIFGLYFYKKHNALMQAILLTMIFIIMLGLYFSYTRAAWLSVMAAVGVMLLIHFKIKFQWILSLVSIVAIVVLASWTQITHYLERNKYEHTTENFTERLQSAANVSTDASNLERLNRWQCAIDMFIEKPVTGFGPGTYAFEYAPFQRPENLTIISTSNGDGGNAHSEYLGALAEMGLVGCLAVLAIVAAIFYQGITLYVKWPSSDRKYRVLIMCMIMALVTYFVHAFLNNFLDTDKLAVPVWGICAIFIALENRLKSGNVEQKI